MHLCSRLKNHEAKKQREWVVLNTQNLMLLLEKVFPLLWEKKHLIYLSVNVFSTKVLIWDTILCLQLETGPPFYVVIWDMPR